MTYKEKILKSIENYSKKQIKPAKKRKHTNVEGPVVLEIYNFVKSIGWSVDIIESKGVYNEEAGRYMHGKTRPGFSDIAGNMPTGTAAYIEVKAPGRRSTLKYHQREFLLEKIKTNSFAICADSVEHVKKMIEVKKEDRVIILTNDLPIVTRDDDLKC